MGDIVTLVEKASETLEEENAEVGLDVDHSDEPPYLTSKYLCDICTIRKIHPYFH